MNIKDVFYKTYFFNYQNAMRTIINKTKKIIKYFLGRFGYRIHKVGPYSIFDFESFLYRYLSIHNNLVFIQIGANDGILNDPIYRFNLKNREKVSGYVIEPLPDVYKKLVENYKLCPNILACNLAIHASESEMILYRVRPEKITGDKEFARGIASFDKDHWRRSGLVSDENDLERVKVNCISFSGFIEINKINYIDLLLIDTEGYDYQILMSIDFSRIKPKIIRFEHGIRDGVMTSKAFLIICDYLNSKGYQIIAENYDATAYLLDADDLMIGSHK